MKKGSWAIVCALCFCLVSFGTQAGVVSSLCYQAYLKNDVASWESPVSEAKKIYQKTKSNADLFQLAIARYGLLCATMQDSNEDVFDDYLDETMDDFETLIENGYRTAECHAILSNIYGLRMKYSPWKGMFLGPKSSSHIDDALQEGEELAIVQKVYGNNKYFTPERWGGSKEEAIKALTTAIQKFEASGEINNWLYLDAYIWLGKSYMESGQKSKALETWQKALKKEPDFGWAKALIEENK